MPQDRFGHTLTTASSDAEDAYIRALDTLFAMQSGATRIADQAIAADPGFALAHCVRARCLLLEGRTRDGIDCAEHALALTAGATAREQRHAEIVARVTRGEGADALALVRDHAASYPRDALPLSFALGVYGLFGFGGFSDHHARQLALLESVADAWDDDWWFLASHGWACVECGQWQRGSAMLDRSLEIRGDNANAAHGRAHGYYESGAAEQGEAFIDAWLPGYSRENPLHCHLSWHQALFALQRGDPERAADIYRRQISPGKSQSLPMFTMVDCAAMLWRFDLSGHGATPAERAELAAFARKRFPKAGIPFVNVHTALSHALEPDGDALDTLLDGVHGLLTEEQQPCGPVVAMLVEALGAFSRGDYRSAADGLATALPDLDRIGGSHAQRDVLIDTLICAQLRAGAAEQARRTASLRARERAGHLDDGWFRRLSATGTARRPNDRTRGNV